MAIHNEVTVRCLLVLADARLDQRSIFQRGKTEGNIFAYALQRSLTDDSLAVCGIECTTARVIGHLETTAVASGDAVEEALAVIAPHGEVRIGEAGISPGGNAEKNVLLGGTDDFGQGFTKQLSQP